MGQEIQAALLAGTALLAASGAAQAQDASLSGAIAAGRPILEMRPRYESVDQANFARDAEAFTVRTRLGWETGAWNGVKALIEFEDVRQLGDEDYNSGINGKALYPTIADPEVTELNRLQIVWTPSKTFGATLGRQRIMFDDQRFIGNVGWRQDEQTFDAARVDLAGGKFKLAVAYLDQVNRTAAEAQDWDSESWLANASWAGPDAFKPVAFVYALDFDNSRLNSNITYGVRATGKAKAAPVTFAYSATYAHQTDYGKNPANFDLDYWGADLAATYKIATLKVGYESLEGNGVRGFATPLATLHAFQGWADAFLVTPANGINDANLTLTLKPQVKLPYLSNIELTARGHSFEAERGGADLGEEIDLLASAAITKQLSVLAKYADYDGAPGFPARTKFWFGFEFKL